MPTKYTPKDIIADLDGIIAVLKKYPTLKIGDKSLKPDEEEWTLAKVEALRKSLDDDLTERDRIERELGTINNDLQDNSRTGNGLVTRARSLFRGQFGPDSDEYEKSGGTRASERKPATRKPKTKTP